MKKNKFIFAAIIFAASMVSCNMIEWDKIVALDVAPTLIKKTPKIYPGGNAECSTINIVGLVQTTGRNNYVPSIDGFEIGWPSGLLVKVDDDKVVSFQIDGSINLGDGKCYKIGAVIVKGSDASNVYDYTDMGGATMDKGLVSPNNSSGGPAALSNLTFCFMECKNPEWVIALKTYMTIPGQIDYSWAASGGLGSDINSLHIGYNNYVVNITNVFPLNSWGLEQIGDITARDYIDGGIQYLEVVVDTESDEWLFKGSYLYVGTLTGLNNLSSTGSDGLVYTNYGAFPFSLDNITDRRVFKIPFTEIVK